MKTLDKTQPYGQIVGDDQGRFFEQDGLYFHGDGSEWIDPAADAVVKAKVERAKTAAVKAVKAVPAVKAVDQQLADQLVG